MTSEARPWSSAEEYEAWWDNRDAARTIFDCEARDRATVVALEAERRRVWDPLVQAAHDEIARLSACLVDAQLDRDMARHALEAERAKAAQLVEALRDMISVGCEWCDMDMGPNGAHAIAQAEKALAAAGVK